MAMPYSRRPVLAEAFMHLLSYIRRSSSLVALALVVALVLPSAALAVTRQAVLQRGEVWVKKKVPYSQRRWATTAGTLLVTDTANAHLIGWRTDCSGFVSMCFGVTRADGSPYSLDTAGLPYRLTKITKGELMPGDVILRPKTSSVGGHVVVFVRWTDSTKTKYVGYHERGSAYGTVAEEIPYPYRGEKGFAPYRYNKIEETRLRKSRTWYAPLTMSALPAPASFPQFFAPPSAGTTLSLPIR
jgi:hypothetical protein